MLSQTYYTLRARQDGKYIVARPNSDRPSQYLLLFQEVADARSYLNTHGADMGDRFEIETALAPQVKMLLERWRFAGIALVRDPLVPEIEFLGRDSGRD